jgi:hypothetical protein
MKGNLVGINVSRLVGYKKTAASLDVAVQYHRHEAPAVSTIMVHEIGHSFHELNDGGSGALWCISTILSRYMLYVPEGSGLITVMRISNLTLLHDVCVFLQLP